MKVVVSLFLALMSTGVAGCASTSTATSGTASAPTSASSSRKLSARVVPERASVASEFEEYTPPPVPPVH